MSPRCGWVTAASGASGIPQGELWAAGTELCSPVPRGASSKTPSGFSPRLYPDPAVCGSFMVSQLESKAVGSTALRRGSRAPSLLLDVPCRTHPLQWVTHSELGMGSPNTPGCPLRCLTAALFPTLMCIEVTDAAASFPRTALLVFYLKIFPSSSTEAVVVLFCCSSSLGSEHCGSGGVLVGQACTEGSVHCWSVYLQHTLLSFAG